MKALLCLIACLVLAPATLAQYGPFFDGEEPLSTRPIPENMTQNAPEVYSGVPTPTSVLGSVGRSLPGAGEGPSASDPDGGGFSAALNVMILLTVLTMTPAIILMCTSFVRIIVALALLRQAIGAQSVPPPQVLTAMSLMLTMLIMAPTFQRVYDEAIAPWQAGEIANYEELWQQGSQPLRDFMFDQIEATGNWSGVYMMLNYQGVDTSEPEKLTRADVSTISLIPAFMLSELKTAFLIGFRVYLPFLVIDIVIASLLISMSMMMLPPVLISLPFKLLLFVLVDGWQLVVGGLLAGFAREGSGSRLSETAVSMAPAVRMFTG